MSFQRRLARAEQAAGTNDPINMLFVGDQFLDERGVFKDGTDLRELVRRGKFPLKTGDRKVDAAARDEAIRRLDDPRPLLIITSRSQSVL